MTTEKSYTAFADTERVAQGDLTQVTRVVKSLVDARDPRTMLVFATPTGEQVDLDLRGTMDQVLARIAAPTPEPPGEEPVRRPPGRPKLGVVGREVTLLPRHWEWLNVQPGGASVVLRKLVDRARSSNLDRDRIRLSREATYRFMTAMAGNELGFEEACRALFAGDRAGYNERISQWPEDVVEFIQELATEAFNHED